MATTSFDMVTPAATLYSGQAEMVVCRTVEGEIAFLADHMPYIGALDPCVVRVVGPEGGESELRFAARGGFVEVKDNRVIMLADLAVPADQVDVEQARQDETEASQPGGDEAEERAAEIERRWAQARLEAAGSASS